MGTDKLKEVYEKYKHLDIPLSDKKLSKIAEDEIISDIRNQILYDLWQAVKEAANPAE